VLELGLRVTAPQSEWTALRVALAREIVGVRGFVEWRAKGARAWPMA
jgi:hypothetical protein